MADDVTFQSTAATPAAGTVVATDDVGGKHYQKIKIALGAENAVDTMLDSGQQSMANSVPVVVASDQSAIPVSASSLPLPSGGATSANQSTIIGHLDGVEGLLTTIDADTGGIATSTASVDTKTPALGQAIEAGSVPVVLPASQIATLTPPSAITGFATSTKQDTVIGHLDGVEGLLTTIDTDTSALAGAVSGTEMQVDVLTLPNVTIGAALPAGANNIGDVDVLSLPALPAGTNNIGDVDVASVVPGTGATNLGKAVDSVAGGTDTGIASLFVRDDVTSTLTPVDGDYVPGRVNARGAQWVALETQLDSTNDSVSALGNVAHDAADSGNPIKIGGRADLTFPAAVADGDRVDALFDVYGAQVVRTDHPNRWSYHEDSSSALTDIEIKAAPGAGLSIYITDISVSTGAATALNFFLEEGATKIFGPIYLEAVAGRGYVVQFKTPKKVTANTAVTITTSAAIAHSVDIQGFIAP